jgi:dUTP pyrophosphatase
MLKIQTDTKDQFIRAHGDEDAGYDIVASEYNVIYPGKSQLISTGLIVAIPKGYVGVIKSRSGLAVKHDIEAGAGVIDPGYRGEVKVLLRNFGTETYGIAPGDKIAQMLILPTYIGPTEFAGSLTETKRGGKGFGSTGYKHGQ